MACFLAKYLANRFLAKYLANRGELFGNVRIGETIISANDPHCDSLSIGSTEARL
jgi:hypothetical protein